jgi:hypothetical protein
LLATCWSLVGHLYHSAKRDCHRKSVKFHTKYGGQHTIKSSTYSLTLQHLGTLFLYGSANGRCSFFMAVAGLEAGVEKRTAGSKPRYGTLSQNGYGTHRSAGKIWTRSG